MWSGRMDFDVSFQHHAVGYALALNNRHSVDIKGGVTGGVSQQIFDTISVRYGITPGSVPGAQLIQVSTKRSRQRTSLARVELPFVPEK